MFLVSISSFDFQSNFDFEFRFRVLISNFEFRFGLRFRTLPKRTGSNLRVVLLEGPIVNFIDRPCPLVVNSDVAIRVRYFKY